MMRLALASVLFALCGCSSYSWTPSLDGQASRTVRLDGVENRLFPHRPGYGYDFGRRLKEEIAVDTRLVLTEGPADVTMSVSLVHFVEPIQDEDRKTGLPLVVRLEATALVVARGKDVPRGETRRKVTASASYPLVFNETRASGMDRLWRDLSRRILDVAADTEWVGDSP